MAKVFVSYSSIDHSFTERVIKELQEGGIECVVDEKNLTAGDPITSKIEGLINSADAILVFISWATQHSIWVGYEVGYAVAKERKIVPFLVPPLTDGDLPPLLQDLKCATSTADVVSALGTVSASRSKPLPPKESRGTTLVVGGGNVEYTLVMKDELKLGTKHQVTSHTLYGGSGLNYSMRLLRAGFPVIPVVHIGDDDDGQAIHGEMLAAAEEHGSPTFTEPFRSTDDIFVPGARTAKSTIVVEGGRRTILKDAPAVSGTFLNHLKNRISRLTDEERDAVQAVLIGHIQDDVGQNAGGHAGACTAHLIDEFRDDCHVFANFGSTQIRQGYTFWKTEIQGLALFQLNLNEMKDFFGAHGAGVPTLEEIISTISKDELNVVITLEKFGAICLHREKPGVMILAWPFDLDRVVAKSSENIMDTTGAGDAFIAGLVSQLGHLESFGFWELKDAVDAARMWAAYCCTRLGGAASCPTEQEIEAFGKKIRGSTYYPIEVKRTNEATDIIRMLDRAY